MSQYHPLTAPTTPIALQPSHPLSPPVDRLIHAPITLSITREYTTRLRLYHPPCAYTRTHRQSQSKRASLHRIREVMVIHTRPVKIASRLIRILYFVYALPIAKSICNLKYNASARSIHSETRLSKSIYLVIYIDELTTQESMTESRNKVID